MFNTLEIKSGEGVYGVEFDETSFTKAGPFLDGNIHIIMDKNLVALYPELLTEFINHPSIILIEANENSKAILQVLPVIEQLLDNGARRGHTLLAIGGGVIQDIVCFISSVLFRGLDWKFIPTTLLSQADSCIGSKSIPGASADTFTLLPCETWLYQTKYIVKNYKGEVPFGLKFGDFFYYSFQIKYFT